MKDDDENKELSCLQYLDVNNLYDWTVQEKRTKSCAKNEGLVKVIVHHSLTELKLNIIILYDGLFNISYCHYNQ